MEDTAPTPDLDPVPTTGSEPDPRVLELYKVAVEMADRVSARRGTANAFFLTVQTAFISLLGLGTPTLQDAPWTISLAISLAGVTLSFCWWLQLRSYRELNRAKFHVINSIEPDLPVQLFTTEWDLLRSEPAPRRSRYMELGSAERAIPAVFTVLYVLVFLSRLLA